MPNGGLHPLEHELRNLEEFDEVLIHAIELLGVDVAERDIAVHNARGTPGKHGRSVRGVSQQPGNRL